MAGARTAATGIIPVGPLGKSAAARSAGVAGSTEPDDCRVNQAVEQEAEKCREAQRLMTHPGVGALTALCFVLIIGEAGRFGCGKQVASYLGLVPLEESSGNRRRLGHITKQGVR